MSGIIDKLRNYMIGADYDDNEEEVSYEEYDDTDNIRDSRDFRNDRESSSREYGLRDRDIADINAARQRRSADRSSERTTERGGSKILDFQANVQLQVVIAYPQVVSDAAAICDSIRDNKAVVVNLEGVERSDAQRIADFLGGASYALQGDIQRISNEIFIIAPAHVHISGDLKEELKSSGLMLPWVTTAFK